jgi:hypothetical protein
VAGCFECGDEPSGSCATELVRPVQYFALQRHLPFSSGCQTGCSLNLNGGFFLVGFL